MFGKMLKLKHNLIYRHTPKLSSVSESQEL